MKEARKSASGIKQNEEGKIYARYMGNLHEMSCAHVCVCVGFGWEGEVLSHVLPKCHFLQMFEFLCKHVRVQRTQCIQTPFNCYCAHECATQQ